ncbi:hypothetical protein DY000_02063873 [Brassica cretica]|uniref:RRM domain-containing protein n=1 Tax=Brassica cretica TaxID=69181 RepID=A0ABQ7AVA8_BRACR|nr:hypothetical protein DY000_02063873 [Brassica cretica]
MIVIVVSDNRFVTICVANTNTDDKAYTDHMAFLSKVGKIIRQTSAHVTASNSMLQSIRCMSSSKIFVGGISYSTDEFGLREAFSKYGEVVDAKIIVDRETGRSRGFAFVTFTSTEEASNAMQLDGQTVFR